MSGLIRRGEKVPDGQFYYYMVAGMAEVDQYMNHIQIYERYLLMIWWGCQKMLMGQ